MFRTTSHHAMTPSPFPLKPSPSSISQPDLLLSLDINKDVSPPPADNEEEEEAPTSTPLCPYHVPAYQMYTTSSWWLSRSSMS